METTGAAGLSRRSVLKGALAASTLAAFAPALASCGRSDSPRPLHLGSRNSDAKAKAGMAALVGAFTERTSIPVSVNVVDTVSFQENLNNYLQGAPDDVFTWMSGYRMRYIANKKLVSPLDAVWPAIDRGFDSSFKGAATDNGHAYLVPLTYYPWAIYYRKSVWQRYGYQPPRTHADFIDLCKRMKSDGIVPLGFAARQGWTTFGMFDYLNLRINGPDFHRSLLAGEISWTDNRVYATFDAWREFLPFQQEQPLGRTIAEAHTALLNRKVGMMVTGLFVSEQFPAGPDLDDLDFCPFPEFDSAIGAGAVEAPLDGLMMSANPRNREAATQFLEYAASAEAGIKYSSGLAMSIPAHKDISLADYSPLIQKAAALVKNSNSITQFLDRDTRPDFSSIVIIPSLQQFIRAPQDLRSVLASIEKQKKAVFDR